MLQLHNQPPTLTSEQALTLASDLYGIQAITARLLPGEYEAASDIKEHYAESSCEIRRRIRPEPHGTMRPTHMRRVRRAMGAPDITMTPPVKA